MFPSCMASKQLLQFVQPTGSKDLHQGRDRVLREARQLWSPCQETLLHIDSSFGKTTFVNNSLPHTCPRQQISVIYINQLQDINMFNPRRDRYNKKLKKYYVVFEEGDEELSEDGRTTHPTRHWSPHPSNGSSLCIVDWPRCSPFKPQVAEDNVEFKRLGKVKEASDSETDESEKEANAKQVNTPKKECNIFCIP